MMDASRNAARAREEGLARLDAVLEKMGADPCIASLPGVVDEISDEVAADAEQERMIRIALRERLGLHPDP